MGSEQFESFSAEADVSTAFETCRDAAAWDHGHAGYTGTIAEKGTFVVFDVPEGHSSEEAMQALESITNPTEVPEWIPRGIFQAYDDKWGPAVAIKREAGGWFFVGWASS